MKIDNKKNKSSPKNNIDKKFLNFIKQDNQKIDTYQMHDNLLQITDNKDTQLSPHITLYEQRFKAKQDKIFKANQTLQELIKFNIIDI